MMIRKKNSFKFLFAALTVSVLSMPPAATLLAEGEIAGRIDPNPMASRGLQERISIDLRDIDIIEALKFLAQKGSLNLVTSKNVTGRISLFLTNVTVADALEIILLSNALAAARQGEILNIMTEAEYQALYGRRYSDLRRIKILKLQYSSPTQAFNMLSTMKSDVGRIVVDEDSGTLFIMDTEERIAAMERTVAELEKAQSVKVIPLRYSVAKDVEAQLKDKLETKKVGTIRADDRSNQVVVTAFPGRMEEVEALIQGLDIRTRQVLIEAKILKIVLDDNWDTGIDWSKVFREEGSRIRGSVASATLPLNNTVTRFGAFTLGNFGGTTDSFTARIRASQGVAETKILASPRITTLNKEPAKILIGTREAYVTTTTTTGQTTSTTSENVTFIDVGITLTVTPIINDLGFVSMKIKPEVSNVVRTLTTPTNNQIPIVDTTTAETSVMVKDGTTIIIGGLRKDEKRINNTQIPFLGSIPVLGNAFKQLDETTERIELVVFLTPHIITGEENVTDETLGYQDKKPKPFKEY